MSSCTAPKHSKIGASSMYRWVACPGSVKLIELAPTPLQNIHAEIGTNAHEVGSFRLVEKRWPLPHDLSFNPTISELMSLQDPVKIYVDYCENLIRSIPNAKAHFEHSFDLSEIYPGLYGTADTVVYDPGNKILHVIDYKNGAGYIVEVFKNYQLLYYALGAIQTLKYNCGEIIMTIVQPRGFHPQGPIRSWRISAVEMIDFELDLIAAAKRTEWPNPVFEPGEHCFFCPAIGLCPRMDEAKTAIANKKMMPLVRVDPKEEFTPVA